MKISFKYSIIGSNNNIYKFDTFTKECNCPNYIFRNNICKHQLSHLVYFKNIYYLKIFRISDESNKENENIHILNLNTSICESCNNNCKEIDKFVNFFLKLNFEANFKSKISLKNDYYNNIFYDIWYKIYYGNNIFLKDIINNILYKYKNKINLI